MPIFQNVKDFIEIFKSDFEEFFKEKYPDENHRRDIYRDILNFIRNEFINQIVFATLPEDEDTIKKGFIYSFKYLEKGETEKKVLKIQDQPSKGDERILIIEFNNKYLDESDETKDKLFDQLRLNWNFLPELENPYEKNRKTIFQRRDLSVDRSNIE